MSVQQVSPNQSVPPARFNLDSPTNTLTKLFWAIAAPLDPPIGIFITQPIADAFALKTYTHGTNFLNYLSIRCHGADPKMGGSDNGSTKIFYEISGVPIDKGVAKSEIENCKGNFFLFKDISDISPEQIYYQQNNNIVKFRHGKLTESEIDAKGAKKYQGKNGKIEIEGNARTLKNYECMITSWGTQFITPLPHKIKNDDSIIGVSPSSFDKYNVRSLLPMRHAAFSGMGEFADAHEKGRYAMCKRVLGAISGLCTPTVSIRVAEGDPLLKHLEVDPDFPTLAYKTQYFISTKYMGIAGIVSQGFSGNPVHRMKNSPTKVCLGVFRLASLVGMIYLLLHSHLSENS